jgi:dynactin-5
MRCRRAATLLLLGFVQSERCLLRDSCVILDDTVLPPDTFVPPFAVFGGAPGVMLGEVGETSPAIIRAQLSERRV